MDSHKKIKDDIAQMIEKQILNNHNSLTQDRLANIKMMLKKILGENVNFIQNFEKQDKIFDEIIKVSMRSIQD